MNDIKILDDFLPSYIQDYLEEIAYKGKISYTLNKTSVAGGLPNFYTHEQWASLFKDSEFIPGFNSQLHYFQIPIQIGLIKLGIDYTFQNLHRLKFNLTCNDHKKVENKINPPHVDPISIADSNSLIGIYYVNESDGDTIIYNDNRLKVIERVSPKKGRLLVMDGKRWHSSSHPSIAEKRMIVNYNIIL